MPTILEGRSIICTKPKNIYFFGKASYVACEYLQLWLFWHHIEKTQLMPNKGIGNHSICKYFLCYSMASIDARTIGNVISGLFDFWSISSFSQNHPTFKQQNSSAEQMDNSSEGKSWFMPQWIPKHFVQAWETKSILPSKSEALQLLLLAFNISKISPPHKRSTECVLGMRGKIPEKVYSSRTLIRYFWTIFFPEHCNQHW